MLERQHNVLLLVADQMRADYIDMRGGEECLTPNLRSLANSGKLLDQCYTTSPICAPARLSLATGMLPINLGALDNACYFPISKPTLYQKLRDNGYRTGIVGKTDLAKPSGYLGLKGDRPAVYSMGFTHPCEIEGKNHSTKKAAPQGPYTNYLNEKGLLESYYKNSQLKKSLKEQDWIAANVFESRLEAHDHIDAFICRRAMEWINNISEEFPWFLQVSFAGPHTPFDPPAEYIGKVMENELFKGLPATIYDDMNNKPQWVIRYAEKFNAGREGIEKAKIHYAAAIHLIDECVGKIVGSLKNSGMYDNTYIVFTADHGEMCGDKGLFTKHVAYEPSMRIPLIFAGDAIRKESSNSSLLEIMDINPTILELCGIRSDMTDAESFLDVLFDKADGIRDNAVCTERNYQCIIDGNYKYIENINDIPELYDRRSDPGELDNIAEKNRDITGLLSLKIKKRLNESGYLR